MINTTLPKEYLKLKLELTGITDTDLAYLAGLVDGEGSFIFHVDYTKGDQPHRNHWRHCVTTIQVANTCREVLEWCVAKFGGNIVNNGLTVNKYAVFIWRKYSKKDLVWITQAIQPYLIIKREQSNIFLDILSHIKTQPGSIKGKDRSKAKVSLSDEYWQSMDRYELLLKSSKHTYKRLSYKNIRVHNES